jgi:acetylornithine deacetylase/succinyl-diaminopimelate desuccinylase-like protein/SAM-dependent methyltransferase
MLRRVAGSASDTWSGASYERIAETFAPIHDRVVEALAIEPGTRVVDVACGTGGVALRAARAGADVTGIDISAHQLAKARRAAEADGLSIRFDEGDCQELPYGDAEFDAVASAFGAIFAPDHERAAAELARVCKPGGRFALTAWPKDEWSDVSERAGRTFPPGADARDWAREERVRGLLGDAFDLELQTGEWRIEADSGEELWELVSTSMPPLRAWLAEQSDEVRARGAGLSRPARVGCPRARLRPRARNAAMNATAFRDEVTDLLQRLIRVDTTNPPGNETAAAELLRDYLEANGIACELIARVPERANLVARIPGGDGPSLLFLGHTDVVLADPAEWSVPPFSGELRDGMVWGRGALDMKSEVAANAVAIASLAREGFRPSGDLIFAATADEEAGDGFGLEWLCQAHPDAVRCDFAINEGGGDRIELEDGRPIYAATVAEKMTAPFRLRVRGRSGHASMPRIADNALVNAVRLIERIAEYRPEPQLGPEVEAFLQVVLGEVFPAAEAVERVAALSPVAAMVIEALLAPTFSPTVISASKKRNVIPALCAVEVDCRLLPGQHPEHVEPMIRAVLGGDVDYELEWIEARGGTRSSLDTPLWRALDEWVAEAEPGASAVPLACVGFTDSHWLREAFGTVAYGFFPSTGELPPEISASLIHSADERIPVADLEFGVSWLRHAARSILG